VKAELFFERPASLSDQVITGIAPPRIRLSRCGLPVGVSAVRYEDGFSADISFRALRPARELFDSAAIPITRRKIHVGKVTAHP
jgi:hypothetical protein